MEDKTKQKLREDLDLVKETYRSTWDVPDYLNIDDEYIFPIYSKLIDIIELQYDLLECRFIPTLAIFNLYDEYYESMVRLKELCWQAAWHFNEAVLYINLKLEQALRDARDAEVWEVVANIEKFHSYKLKFNEPVNN